MPNSFRNILCSSGREVLPLALYQQAIGQRVKKLTYEAIIQGAENCNEKRDFDGMRVLSEALISSDNQRASAIGRYYQSLVVKQQYPVRWASSNVRESVTASVITSEAILNSCEGDLIAPYRSKALLVHGANAAYLGNQDDAAQLFNEAAKAGMANDLCDLKSVAASNRILCCWRAMEGDKSGALSALDDLFPLAKTAATVSPFLYYDHLDTRVWILMKMGKWDEASRISGIVAAAPMARSYPNWTEHHAVVSRAVGRRTMITVPANLNRDEMPPQAEYPLARSTVTSIQEWKARKAEPQPEPESITDKKLKCLDLLHSKGWSESDLDSLLSDIPWQAKHIAINDWIVGCMDEAVVDATLQSLLKISGS